MEWHDKIYVTGFPWYMFGWNGILTKSNELKDGCPVYIKEQSVLFFIFLIHSYKIYRKNGTWYFQREVDKEPISGIYKEPLTPTSYPKEEDKSPLGWWIYDGICNSRLKVSCV